MWPCTCVQMNLINRLKYGFSHLMLLLTWKKMRKCYMHVLNYDYKSCCRRMKLFFVDKLQNQNNIWINLVGHLSSLVLIAALSLGLYTRWIHSQDIAIILIAFLGLFIFAISCALVYYFSMKSMGCSLVRLWIGCLLGMIAFTEDSRYETDTPSSILEAMDVLLMISLAMRWFHSILDKIIHGISREKPLFNSMDHLEMVGMAVASIVSGREFFAITLLVTAFGVNLLTIRLKSYLGVLNTVCLITITSTLFFPKLLDMKVNPFALSCFAGRLLFEPIVDLYFSNLSTIERWQPLLQKSGLFHKLSILLMMLIEMTFVIVSAKQMPNHKEWYIVVPIFTVFLVVWLTYHTVFLITCWQLSNKISECNATNRSLPEENRNMHRIMASKGIRHFALIAQRLLLVAFITTIVIAAIGFETKSSLSVSLWLVVVPLEICILNLIWDMGSSLGGTCIGYALVAPSTSNRQDQNATLLAANVLESLGSRATTILNTVQRFFSYHLIATYGCDYSSSGLTMESVRTKLLSFFTRHTSNGPRYDTYLVYYSGPVYDNGDWALAGNGVLKFEMLVEWWRESNSMSGARLILLLDSEFSHRWLRQVRRLSDDFISIQCASINSSVAYDEEFHSGIKIGDFTQDWMDYNSCNMLGVNWSNPDRAFKAMYGVSSSWTNFRFLMPTQDDIARHWDENFPKCTRPLIKATNVGKIGNTFCCCECLVNCLKRTRMAWLPPAEFDTGHGYKLVRS